MPTKQRSPDDYPPFLRSLAELVERLGKKIELLRDQSQKTDEQLRETDEQLKDLGRQMAEASAESKRESAELRRQMAESLAEASAESKRESAELRRQMSDASTEFRQQMVEASVKSKEEWAEIRRQSGEVDRRFGDLAEAMTLGDVLDLLNNHPQINVHSLRHNDHGVHKGNNYEIDAFAFGDDCVVVMEAKATLKSGHVSDFIYKSVNLKDFFDIHQYHRGKKLYGAVAYLKIDDQARELANKKGLLIIRSTYSNKTLDNPQIKLRDYTPRQDANKT